MRGRLRSLLVLLLVAIATPQVTKAIQVRPAKRGGEIRGRITDASGGVLPGFTVAARPMNPRAKPVEVQTTSDSTGAFQITDLPAGQYRLVASLSGFKTRAVATVLKDREVADVSFSMMVGSIIDCTIGSTTRDGSVRDPTGSSVTDAILIVTTSDNLPQSYEVVSDGRIHHCFQAVISDQVEVEAAGFGRQLVKARGVDPASMSWDLVLKYPPTVLEEMVHGFVPEIPTVALWPGEIVVGIATMVGDFVIAVDTARAPLTSANFLRYVDAGLYNGGRFHRVTRPDNYTPALPNRPPMELIQGGIDPGRRSGGFPAIKLERTSVTAIRHTAGTVSMARTAPDSATSDFFILLDGQPSLDFGGKRFDDGQGAAAFGRLLTGIDVVRAIQRRPAQGQNLTPPVEIIAVKRAK